MSLCLVHENHLEWKRETPNVVSFVSQGLIDEGQVDTFNLPLYAASLEELEGLVVKNGCFSIEKMEFSDPATWLKGPLDITQWVMHIRAVMECMFATHFGSHEIVDQMFQRSTQKLSHQSELINSRCHEPSQLLAVLKRKWHEKSSNSLFGCTCMSFYVLDLNLQYRIHEDE